MNCIYFYQTVLRAEARPFLERKHCFSTWGNHMGTHQRRLQQPVTRNLCEQSPVVFSSSGRSWPFWL